MTSLLLLCLLPGVNQIPQLEPQNSLALKLNEKAAPRLSQAREKIAKGDWSNAIRLLQSVLEDENPLYEAKAKKIRNAHQEVSQLLSGMSKKGKDFYELKYGAIASMLLKKSNDRKSLALIVRRFRHTKAGKEAEKKLRAQLKSALQKPVKVTNALPKKGAIWGSKLYRREFSTTLLDKVLETCRKKAFPLMTSALPTLVTASDGKKKHPLVVYRYAGGISARTIPSGEVIWRSPHFDFGIQRMLRSPDTSRFLSRWVDRALEGVRPDTLFASSTMHTLSADADRVYSVNDFVHPPPYMREFIRQRAMRAWPVTLRYALNYNTLQAYHIGHGKLLWEIGSVPDFDEKRAMPTTHFLSAPLPLNGELFVLTQKGNDLSLCGIDAKNGKILRSMNLAKIAFPISKDPFRRMNAHHLAVQDGLLICPTHVGHVIAVDLLTWTPRWIYRYSSEKGKLPWWHSRPIIHGDRLLMTMPDDGKRIHCLNLKTGEPLWVKPRGDDLYLAGAQKDQALLVGRGQCRALDLKTGKERWTQKIGEPSGRGVFTQGRYYLPIAEGLKSKKPEVCELDLQTGKIRARVSLKKPLGNLAIHDDRLIGLGVSTIRVYEISKK